MTSDKATASLAELKKQAAHPMLPPDQKKRVEEMIRQLENYAASPPASNMTALNWQAIIAMIMQILQIFLPPAPTPTPTPPAPQATGGKKN